VGSDKKAEASADFSEPREVSQQMNSRLCIQLPTISSRNGMQQPMQQLRVGQFLLSTLKILRQPEQHTPLVEVSLC
jgi:hypothetical protein